MDESSGDGWGAEGNKPSRELRPCGVGNAVRHSNSVGHAATFNTIKFSYRPKPGGGPNNRDEGEIEALS